MGTRKHWDNAYGARAVDRLGWYAPTLTTSLALIEALDLDPGSPLIDVGGGASTLVDELLRAGYRRITVLDISGKALRIARERLGDLAGGVTWLNRDVTNADLPAGEFGLWHDRAVFHFLTEPSQRALYKAQLLRALRPDGHVVIGTFAPEAPPRCSGLPVQRYDENSISEFFGPELRLVETRRDFHVTPGGVDQPYVYARFQSVTR